MDLTRADVQRAGHTTYFLQVHHLAAIADTDNFKKHAIPEFSTLKLDIAAHIADLVRLNEEAEEVYYEQLGEDADVRGDAEATAGHLAAAQAWIAEGLDCLALAERRGAPDVKPLRIVLDERTPGTADAAYHAIRASIPKFSAVDLPTYFLNTAWIERGLRLTHDLRDRPKRRAQSAYDRETATRRLYELRDLMADIFLEIAAANVIVAHRVGAKALGFHFGILKSDRPDAPTEDAPPPISGPSGPSFRVVGGEDEG